MIEAWTDGAAAHGHSSWMDQFANFTSEFRSKLFQHRLEITRRPFFRASVFVAQPDESIKRPGFIQSFLYRLRVKRKFLREEVSDPVRNIFEEFDLFLHDF